MHLVHTSRAPQYLSDCVQTVARSSLVSDPLTQPSTSSRGAEPSSASAVSVMLDPLLGTVFHTTFTKSLTLVFLSVV